MVGFRNIAAMVNAELEGRSHYATWRKSPTQTTTAGVWFDLSMSPGNPVPQYYAASPLVAVALAASSDGGLWAGKNQSPLTKYLRKITALSVVATALPMPMILLDYLMYYPFIDEGTNDEQPLTTGIALPRYPDGRGVQIMAVSVAGRTGGQTFRVIYTNQDGVTGRVSGTVTQNTATANGHLVNTARVVNAAAGPFIPLQSGDTGVQKIESVAMISGTDVGLFTLVLVKPLLQMQIRGIDAPVEVDCFLDKASAPAIMDDAYLNFICLPNGALNATAIHGDLQLVWN